MTDIRKTAEERYPHWLPPEPGTPDPDYSEIDASWQNEMADDQRNAFIAGAEWMREQAVRSINALQVDRGQTRMSEPMVSLQRVLTILKENDDD